MYEQSDPITRFHVRQIENLRINLFGEKFYVRRVASVTARSRFSIVITPFFPNTTNNIKIEICRASCWTDEYKPAKMDDGKSLTVSIRKQRQTYLETKRCEPQKSAVTTP